MVLICTIINAILIIYIVVTNILALLFPSIGIEFDKIEILTNMLSMIPSAIACVAFLLLYLAIKSGSLKKAYIAGFTRVLATVLVFILRILFHLIGLLDAGAVPLTLTTFIFNIVTIAIWGVVIVAIFSTDNKPRSAYFKNSIFVKYILVILAALISLKIEIIILGTIFTQTSFSLISLFDLATFFVVVRHYKYNLQI